jgi:acyl-CoA thioester hydrolase
LEVKSLSGRSEFCVYYEDTDFSGFVYHANYLKFFERGREHLIGIDHLAKLFREGTHFVVRHMNIDFRSPAKHGDTLEIRTTCHYSRSPALIFEQEALLAGSSEVLVKATIKAALLGPGNKPIRMPDSIYENFKNREKSGTGTLGKSLISRLAL